MATRRGRPTRFNRENRIRVRDNIKIKRVTTISPYVISGRDINPSNSCDIIEAVVPVTGKIYSIVTNLKNASTGIVNILYINDEEFVGDFYGRLVKWGDIIKYTVKTTEPNVKVASKVLCSIAILPIYNKKLIVSTKVNKDERV